MTKSDDPYPIRPVSQDEFDAFHRVDMHAFHGSPVTEDDKQKIFSVMEFDRSLAAFDGPTPVGTAGAYTFALSVPGPGTLPAAGVTWVSVLPSHRRRGVLRSMMRYQLADVRERGEPLAILWASESVIYSRYGYGRAMWHADLTLRRGEGTLAPWAPRDPGLRLRLVEPGAALTELAKVYDAVLPSRPGLIARNDAWWQRTVHDPADSRQGATPLHCLLAEDDSGPRGYALYRGQPDWDRETSLPDAVLTVRELAAVDPAASAAMWTDLLSRDLTTEFRVRARPVDDPLLFQLTDPRRARARLKDALWVRITDVPGALTGRRYSSAVDVVIEVRDELLPANAGRWRLATSGPGGADGYGASCQPSGSAADVELEVTALGAAYLGGTGLGGLAGAGLVTERRPGAVRQLAAALAWEPAPWCPVDF
jgi:predicted acetyltransferase